MEIDMEPTPLNIKLVAPRVKLHWATLVCKECGSEDIETIATEMYMCRVCRHVDSGRTEWLETKIVDLDNSADSNP